MVQGCPIVATDSGGIGELIESGVTGLLARNEDIDDICSKLMEILGDPVSACRMGESARQHAIQRHSTKKLAADTVNFYGQVLAMAAK